MPFVPLDMGELAQLRRYGWHESTVSEMSISTPAKVVERITPQNVLAITRAQVNTQA
jgi:hypothetical protein